MALRLCHRQSIDFDFFSNEKFESADLVHNLSFLKEARIDSRSSNTLTVTVDRGGPVQVSFFGDVRMKSVEEPDLAPENELQIASLLDLAATKLKTIQQRAEAKDYLDIAAALSAGITISMALSSASAIYGRTFNPLAAVKSLTYFGDGNLPALPLQIQERLRASAEQVDLKSLPVTYARNGITRPELPR